MLHYQNATPMHIQYLFELIATSFTAVTAKLSV
jgi:hypothetical protein